MFRDVDFTNIKFGEYLSPPNCWGGGQNYGPPLNRLVGDKIQGRQSPPEKAQGENVPFPPPVSALVCKYMQVCIMCMYIYFTLCEENIYKNIYKLAASPLASSGFAAFGCFRALPYGGIYIFDNFRN